VKIPSSLKKLTVEIEAACGTGCAWILITPALPAHQKLWIPRTCELVRPAHPEGVVKAIKGAPGGGHAATGRADWVRKLVEALGKSEVGCSDHLVLAVTEKAQVSACVGWLRSEKEGNSERLISQLGVVRAQVRKAWDLEKVRTEAEALRWLLARSDRTCMVARPDGELLGASLCGREFLQELRFGPRHIFRTDEPELPAFLARSIGQSDAGQVVVGKGSTARFERLALADSWMPVYGVECFTESSTHRGLPISRLTSVERDIYNQIATTGASNREIAQRRGTSYATVKNQVSGLLSKLGVARRINLLAAPVEPQFLQAKVGPGAGGMISVNR
jgi:DNA-binding CsgD family transcriptional regulator